jgi:hypothetical protein
VLSRDRVHLRGRVIVAAAGEPELPRGRIDPPDRWSAVEYPAAREEIIYHGPIFRRLSGARMIDGVGWMKIDAETIEPLAGRRGPAGWILSPAVLDACLFGCGLHTWIETEGVVAIPQAIGRLRLGRLPQPGETCVQRVERISRTADRAVFNFVLGAADGSVILAAEGFEAVILAGMTKS